MKKKELQKQIDELRSIVTLLSQRVFHLESLQYPRAYYPITIDPPQGGDLDPYKVTCKNNE